MNTKEYTITFGTFVGAIKHHWKAMLLIFVLFIGVGFGASVLFAEQGSAASAGAADPLLPVDFSELEEDTNYYTNAENLLSTACQQAVTYSDALLSDRSLTLEQRQAVHAVQKDIQKFQQTEFSKLAALRKAPDLFVPVTLLDETAEQLQRTLKQYQRELTASSADYELLQTMDAPESVNDEILAAYQSIIKSAAQHSSLLRTIATYEEELRKYEEPSALIREIRAYEAELQKALSAYNALRQEMVACADGICRENALLLKVDAKELDTFEPVVYHTHTAAPQEDAAKIIVLFMALTGLCVGVFVAVCLEAKARKESAASAV